MPVRRRIHSALVVMGLAAAVAAIPVVSSEASLVVIPEHHTFEEAPPAFDFRENGSDFGKIVIRH